MIRGRLSTDDDPEKKLQRLRLANAGHVTISHRRADAVSTSFLPTQTYTTFMLSLSLRCGEKSARGCVHLESLVQESSVTTPRSLHLVDQKMDVS